MRRVWWLALVVACAKAPEESDSGETDDTDTAVPTGPCADGGWGLITDPDAVHVRSDGSDGGTGTVDAPLATLDAALEAVRAGGPRRIAIGPGTYPASLSLLHDRGGSTSDDDLAIEGCSPDEVTIEAADAGAPVIKATGVERLSLVGFSTSGGRRAIWLWQGADVDVSDVSIVGAERLGLVMDGSITALTAARLSVRDTVAEDGEFGYGISIQGASASLVDGDVTGNEGVGIFADFAVVSLDGVRIADTRSDAAGAFGRGVQLQGLTAGTLTNLVLSGNHDAAVYASQALDTTVSGLNVDATAAVTLGSGTTTGDGLVFTQGDAGGDPAIYQVTLSANTVTGSSRAGILIEGVAAAVSGNVTAGNGYDVGGSSIVAQGSAIVTGDDAVFDATGVPLEVEHTPLIVDPLVD